MASYAHGVAAPFTQGGRESRSRSKVKREERQIKLDPDLQKVRRFLIAKLTDKMNEFASDKTKRGQIIQCLRRGCAVDGELLQDAITAFGSDELAVQRIRSWPHLPAKQMPGFRRSTQPTNLTAGKRFRRKSRRKLPGV